MFAVILIGIARNWCYILVDMMLRLTGRKTLAMFVLAFLCLNVGGALCLTYCSQMAMAAASNSEDTHLSEHCRRAKKEAEDKNQNSSVNSDEAACCMMPIALFTAPVEKRSSFTTVLIAEAPAAVEFDHSAPAIAGHEELATPVYRPPPLDRRVDRILNCVIRI